MCIPCVMPELMIFWRSSNIEANWTRMSISIWHEIIYITIWHTQSPHTTADTSADIKAKSVSNQTPAKDIQWHLVVAGNHTPAKDIQWHLVVAGNHTPAKDIQWAGVWLPATTKCHWMSLAGVWLPATTKCHWMSLHLVVAVVLLVWHNDLPSDESPILHSGHTSWTGFHSTHTSREYMIFWL